MTTPAAYLSHSDALRNRCEGVLRDLEETQQGLGKEWKNVQPCVANASKLLLQQVRLQDERLTALEEKMDQVLNAVEVIANDSRLKEQRYRMDRETTERALEELQLGAQQLHSAIETERRATLQFREEILYPGLADLQQQIDGITTTLRSFFSPVQAQQPAALSSSLLPSSPPIPVSAVCATVDSDRNRGGDDSLLKEIVREIGLLRSQWEHLQLHTALPALVHGVEEKRTASPTTVENRKNRLLSFTSRVDCSAARWQWRGGHLSTPMLLVETPIPWSTMHVRMVATGEWLSVGAMSDGTLLHSELNNGKGPPIVWRPQRSSVIELAKGGIYRVMVCLISSYARRPVGKTHENEQPGSTSSLPTVTLRINDKSVFSFFAGGTTCYTLQAPRGSSKGRAKPVRSLENDKKVTSCQVSACSRRPCSCGAATTFTTSSFADILRLPAGATVSVYCNNASDVGSVHEALLEVELLAE